MDPIGAVIIAIIVVLALRCTQVGVGQVMALNDTLPECHRSKPRGSKITPNEFRGTVGIMRVLITGLNGTLAPKVAAVATQRGWQVLPWDRTEHPPEHPDGLDWLEHEAVDAVLHLAMGSEAWAARLAAFSAGREIPFVFTSTAMVFDHQPNGPHQIEATRSAKDEYGRYKIRCEDAIRRANPNACIARIGYQIDWDARGNNMLAHLEQQAANGGIEASSAWVPACSFMNETATALCDLLERHVGGVLHLDSNQETGYTFDQIVLALKAHLRRDWSVRVARSYEHDQRLVGSGLLPALHDQLPELRANT
jgi:dTDP-4-dehydrorhamnose reductase